MQAAAARAPSAAQLLVQAAAWSSCCPQPLLLLLRRACARARLRCCAWAIPRASSTARRGCVRRGSRQRRSPQTAWQTGCAGCLRSEGERGQGPRGNQPCPRACCRVQCCRLARRTMDEVRQLQSPGMAVRVVMGPLAMLLKSRVVGARAKPICMRAAWHGRRAAGEAGQ